MLVVNCAQFSQGGLETLINLLAQCLTSPHPYRQMKRCSAAMLGLPSAPEADIPSPASVVSDINPSCPTVVAAQLHMLPVSVCDIVSAYVMATAASAQSDVEESLVLLQRADDALQLASDLEDENLHTLFGRTHKLRKMYRRLAVLADTLGDEVVSSLINGHADVVANEGIMEQDVMGFFRRLTMAVDCLFYDADTLSHLFHCVVLVEQADPMYQRAAQKHDDRQWDHAQANAAWLAATAIAAYFATV